MNDTVTQLIYTETSAGRYLTGAGATSYSGLLGGGATTTHPRFQGLTDRQRLLLYFPPD